MPTNGSGSPWSFADALQGSLREADRLANVEDSRHAEGGRLLDRAWASAQRPAYDDRMFQREFGRIAEDAADSRNRLYSSLRQGLGASGVGMGSGFASGIARRIETERAGQMQAGRRELMQRQAETNAAQRMSLLGQAFGMADYKARSPSVIRLDALQDATGAYLGLEGIKAQREAANQASADNRQNGMLGLLGNVFSGVLGAI